uniref:Amidohydrolase-related domain-containing protein n=1 Tax=Phlebotomus papatasi TaxID=29031 RepID=A0A1B0D8B1_PHLPP
MGYLFVGQIVHSKSFDELEVIDNGFLAVENGKIIAIGDATQLPNWRKDTSKYEVIRMTKNQFILPGFIDCHIHAPQMPNIGLGLNMELLDWLKTYTFPMESQYKDSQFAAYVYAKVVAFIEGIKALNSDLISVTITPRFALSCDEYLMNELGKLAKEHNLNIQTHISENLGEIAAVKEVFRAPNYASVYDSANLLTPKCILAHGVHLEDEEIDLLKARGTSVAHCPSSNTNLQSGLCDVLRLRKAGVAVGLGTDISGGSNVSILTTIRDALGVSHHLNFVKKQNIKGTGSVTPQNELQKKVNEEYVPMNYKQALYLATLGGAEALNLSQKIGNFEVGKEFDALLIDIDVDPIDVYTPNVEGIKDKPENLEERIQKFIYTGDDRNISRVFVKGKPVK